MAGQVSKPFVAALAVAVGVGANIWLGYSKASWPAMRVFVWILTIACILSLLMTMGKAINGRWEGIIIDARNKVSLSKLQATVWTVVVASALATYAATRAALSGEGVAALDFDIPPELLIAMGISTASLVASPAVLSLKTGTGGALPWNIDGAAKIDRADGTVAGRSSPEMASWLDIFRGDEVSNADAPDLSKVQQFLITIVLVFVYGAEIADALYYASSSDLKSLPIINERMVWLLGVSHAAYIGYKAVPHSGSDSNTTKTEASVG